MSDNITIKFGFVAGSSKSGRRGINLSEENQALIIKGSFEGKTAKSLYAEAMVRHNEERATKGLAAEVAPLSYEKHPSSLIYGLKARFAQRLGKGNVETKAAAEKVGLPAVAPIA
jgi:hypothetical protein